MRISDCSSDVCSSDLTAVIARGGEDDLVRLLARVEALGSFLASDDGANLLTAYRRAANIVRIEEKKDKRASAGAVQAEKRSQTEKKTLFSHLTSSEERRVGKEWVRKCRARW